jgi:putative transposase
LIIQRAVEDEFDAWLGRARYERRPEWQRGLRNGFRPRKVQTAEGELEVELPQIREAAEPFVSKLFPRGTKLLRTEPLRAMVIGAFVRGLSLRDVESLCAKAGLGKLSKSTAARICQELRERFEAFKRRDLYDLHLVALFLDAVFLCVRPDRPKEGVLVAWGFTEEGERVLLSVMLGMRESHEDWLELGRDLIARGLGAPLLIVADGAPGLIKAVEQCWAASDRQHCAVHRVRNLLAKLPERERERVRQAYWQALDEANDERDGKQRLQALVDQLDKAGYTAAARCLADDLDALVVHLRYPTRHRRRWRSTNLLERSLGEVKRRTKVIGRFPGETSCLTLVWAVLDLYITHATNGIKFTELERQRLKRMSYEGHGQPSSEEVTPLKLTATGNLGRGEFTAPKGRDQRVRRDSYESSTAGASVRPSETARSGAKGH